MSSKENCKESVLEYLKVQNRPYSANDIIQNLHKEFGKTIVQKALDDLTLECKIKEKIYGKQKVYAVVQGEEVGLTESVLDKMEIDIGAEAENLKISEQELKKNETILKELESEPTTEVALSEKRTLQDKINYLTDKVDNFSKSTFRITDEDKNKVYKDRERFTKEYKKRKQTCMDVVNSILENYPKKVKVLFDEIGIEVDPDS